MAAFSFANSSACSSTSIKALSKSCVPSSGSKPFSDSASMDVTLIFSFARYRAYAVSVPVERKLGKFVHSLQPVAL